VRNELRTLRHVFVGLTIVRNELRTLRLVLVGFTLVRNELRTLRLVFAGFTIVRNELRTLRLVFVGLTIVRNELRTLQPGGEFTSFAYGVLGVQFGCFLGAADEVGRKTPLLQYFLQITVADLPCTDNDVINRQQLVFSVDADVQALVINTFITDIA